MNVDPWSWIAPLVLLALANGAPVLATRVLDGRWSWPLDGGIVAWDGRRLLGSSKTLRGVCAALAATAAAAPVLGLPVATGVTFALASLLGDAASSFTKRRLGVETSGRAFGLDQIPEALLPLLVCYRPLALTPADVIAVVVLFTLGQVLVSPLMFRFGLRRRPY